MSTTLTEQEPLTAEPEHPHLPDERCLEDHFPESLKASRAAAGLTAVVMLLFVFLNARPLWHTDLWGHLAYGRTIWNSGAVPTTEPLLPLAEGVTFVDTAWLSQLIGFAAYSQYGVAALKFLYAACITLAASLLLFRCYRHTRSAWFGLGALAAFLWVEWQQLTIVRPQLAGFACFALLFCLLTSRNWSRSNWVFVPFLFALWGNLHGSFAIGLVVQAAFCAGRAVDVLRKTRKPAAVIHDRFVRRYFVLTELAAMAVLLNPYGLAVYAEVLSFAGNANLADLIEWQPLTLRMSQGKAAAALALALMVAYRLSPRRVSAVEVLLLVGFGGWSLWTSRMILWWVLPAVYYLALHAAAAWKRHRRMGYDVEPSPGSGRWTVITGALVWIGLALTPMLGAVLHGVQPDFKKSVSPHTPLAAVEYLHKNRPQGQVFNTMEYGDYLLWAGPEKMQVFAASHVHLVPREVWKDYMLTIDGHEGWLESLERYGVNTVILDQRYRTPLIDVLKTKTDWELGFEDNLSAVFLRRKPI